MIAPASRLDVAIVGCGISGMAAALFLDRAGHQVRIFERFAAPRPLGSGLLLQPLGLAVLDRLGLGERVRGAGARIERLLGHTHPRGWRILDVAYADLGDGLCGIGIHRANLFAALHDPVAASEISVEAATAVASLDRAADGRPLLVDDKGRRHGPFDLAVDASGAKSALRSGLDPGRRARPFGFGALWTTVPLAGSGFAAATLAQRYVAARRMIGVMPLGACAGAAGPPHAAFFWSLRMDRFEAWRSRGLDSWKDEVAAIWPEAAGLVAHIDDPDQMAPALYVHATVRHPVASRLALIGDAAHATSPQLGQGANMGLIDAAALADALACHRSLDDALADYARTRERHVRFYQAASWWLTPLFQSDRRAPAWIRDAGFPVARNIPYFRRDIAYGLAGLKPSLFGRMEAQAPEGPLPDPGLVRRGTE